MNLKHVVCSFEFQEEQEKLSTTDDQVSTYSLTNQNRASTQIESHPTGISSTGPTLQNNLIGRSAKNCCKLKSIPIYCVGFCVPRGKTSSRSMTVLGKCKKHLKEIEECIN